MLMKFGCTHCSSNCLRTKFSINDGGCWVRSLEFQSAKAKYPPSFFEKLVLKQLLEQWVHPNFISINEFSNILRTNENSSGRVISENWNSYTNPSWYDSIIEGIRRPFVILSLGPIAIVKSIREIPTILLMNWAFKKGLMEFGVYKCRG